MEQTNLVVTSDGQTWDEVTRDVSYIGKIKLSLDTTVDKGSFNEAIDWDKCRGTGAAASESWFNKDFALAYDSQICLKSGFYRFDLSCHYITAGGNHMIISVNGTMVKSLYPGTVTIDNHLVGHTCTLLLQRGDVVRVGGRWGATSGNFQYTKYQITKV
jgi:hypothetical protein